MKVFKKVKTYLTGKGFITTDILFDDKIRAFENITGSEEIFIPDECMVVSGFIDEHIHGAGGA